jgi:hypothetical protein
MVRQIAISILVVAFCIPATAWAQEHAVAGELEKVGQDGKTITVKTADGTEHVFKVTGKTALTGTEKAAKDVGLAGKEGSQVVVKYTGEGADKTAHAVDVTGKDAF